MALEKRKTPLSLDVNMENETKKKAAKQTAKKVVKKEKIVEPVETTVKSFSKRVNPLTINENKVDNSSSKVVEKQIAAPVETKVLPNLPEAKKNAIVVTFVRKDVLSVLKNKMNVSTKDIVNKAIETLLKEEFEEEYIKLAKGE